jgi:hypothetical protein
VGALGGFRPIMTRMVSVERAAALRNKCLNLTEKLSIGFRFGEGTDVAVATVDVAHWHIASFRCLRNLIAIGS